MKGAMFMATRGRPTGSKDKKSRQQLPEAEIDENARRIDFLDAIEPDSPADPNNLQEIERRFRNYIQVCREYGFRISNMNAYTAIGIDEKKAYDWEHGANPEIRWFITKVKRKCSSYRELLGTEGKIHPATLIFWQKNYDGLKDEQEHVITANNNFGDSVDKEELSKRYLENADIVPVECENKSNLSLPVNDYVESSS